LWIFSFSSSSAAWASLEEDMDNSTPTPFRILCTSKHGCGEKTFITKEEYKEQMAYPDRRWRCPCCLEDAYFDDDNFEASI
jgi:hypothetical protein